MTTSLFVNTFCLQYLKPLRRLDLGIEGDLLWGRSFWYQNVNFRCLWLTLTLRHGTPDNLT